MPQTSILPPTIDTWQPVRSQRHHLPPGRHQSRLQCSTSFHKSETKIFALTYMDSSSSPHRAPAFNVHLMNATGSNKVLYATELAPLIKPFQAMDPSTSSKLCLPFRRCSMMTEIRHRFHMGNPSKKPGTTPSLSSTLRAQLVRREQDLDPVMGIAGGILHKACPNPSQ